MSCRLVLSFSKLIVRVIRLLYLLRQMEKALIVLNHQLMEVLNAMKTQHLTLPIIILVIYSTAYTISTLRSSSQKITTIM